MTRPRLWPLVGVLAVVAATSSTAAPEEPNPGAGTSPAAQAPDSLAAPTFLIERIVVSGVRHGSEKIVAAETLLAPGGVYSEPQLQQALQRVERLPFVVQADFSLRRGSERGRFELVVAITEAAPVFFGGTLDLFLNGGCCFRESRQADGRGPGLGARVFFGGRNELSAGLGGVVHSSLEGTSVDWNVAYTRHDLLGRHAAATIAFAPGTNERSLSARLAVPLDHENVLTLSAERTKRDWFWGGFWSYPEEWSSAEKQAYAERLVVPGQPSSSPRVASRRFALNWQRDTTDDPFTPRSGSRIEVETSFTDSDYDDPMPFVPPLRQAGPTGGPTSGPASVRERALSGLVRTSRYWPLSRRLSFGLEAGLGASVVDATGSLVLDGVTLPVAPDDRGMRASASALLIGSFPELGSGRTSIWWTLGASLSNRSRWRDCDASPVCDVLPRVVDAFQEDERYGEDDVRQTRDMRMTHLTIGASVAVRGRYGKLSLGVHYRHYLTDRVQ